MTIKEQIEFLRAHSSTTNWREKAEWRRDNKEFLEKFRKKSIQEEIKKRGL